jgi:hypothetical protein
MNGFVCFQNQNLLGLFRITRAAITPGTQPQRVRINTTRSEPHPWSYTAKGGKKMESTTRQKLINRFFQR